jgi:Nuclear pore protein 84 / 107
MLRSLPVRPTCTGTFSCVWCLRCDTLQLIAAPENWRVSASCSFRSLYSAFTRFWCPHVDTYPSALLLHFPSSHRATHNCPFASNVRHALRLANTVADSRYMLYTEFAGENGRRLKEYLAAVRTAVLAGLEHGGSDPFRAVL